MNTAASPNRESLGPEPGAGGRWICIVCGFIYDPAEGDPDSGIPPGTAFEDIPEDWVCPECHVTKADFEPLV